MIPLGGCCSQRIKEANVAWILSAYGHEEFSVSRAKKYPAQFLAGTQNCAMRIEPKLDPPQTAGLSL